MSSLWGAAMSGNRARRMPTISAVSSTDSVVWVTKASFEPGGLYARFADKLALVHAVDEQLVRQFETALGRAMAPPALADLDCSGVIRAYVTAMVRYFTRHRALLRHVVLRARGSGDPAFSRRVRALNRFAHGRIGDELRRRRHEITHPDPAAAAAFGVMLVSAAARECVLFGNRRLGGTALRGPRLVDELVRSYCAYLGVACTKE